MVKWTIIIITTHVFKSIEAKRPISPKAMAIRVIAITKICFRLKHEATEGAKKTATN